MSKLSDIIYIEPSRCFFYGASVQDILELDFPADVAKDSEVLSKEKLGALILAFFQTNNIAPSDITLIMSPALTFEKDLTGLSLPQQTTESQVFLDAVPFENVVSLTANITNKKILAATNKDFIDAIRVALSTQKFSIPAAIPFSILSILVPELQTNMDLKLVFQRWEMARSYNFLSVQELPQVPETFTGKPKNITRVLALVGVFIVLLAVLAYVAITNLAPTKAPVRRALPIPTPTKTVVIPIFFKFC